MAADAELTIYAEINNLPSGDKTVGPLTITSANANGNTADYALSAGFNTVTVPISTATPILAGVTPKAAVIIPKTGNTSSMTLKGVTEDTGIPMSLTAPFILGFPALPPASFGIAVDTTATTCQIVWI